MKENKNYREQRVYEPEILEPAESGHDGQNRTRTYSGTWVYSTRNNDGCLASFITLLLFIICGSSFGFLGAIGFLFFYLVLAIIGTMLAARRMLTGRFFNIWQLRVFNWLLSFLLVFWFSGN